MFFNRIGADISDITTQPRQFRIMDFKAERCSIGFFLQSTENKNLNGFLCNFQADTCYYGAMLDLKRSHGKIYLSALKFSDVPKPILYKKRLGIDLEFLTPNTYKFPRLDSNVKVEKLLEIELEKKLRMPIYRKFCSEEKLPFRVEYNHDDFSIITTAKDEPKTIQV